MQNTIYKKSGMCKGEHNIIHISEEIRKENFNFNVSTTIKLKGISIIEVTLTQKKVYKTEHQTIAVDEVLQRSFEKTVS